MESPCWRPESDNTVIQLYVSEKQNKNTPARFRSVQ